MILFQQNIKFKMYCLPYCSLECPPNSYDCFRLAISEQSKEFCLDMLMC